jgi:uncharacterized protein (DUF433 family)
VRTADLFALKQHSGGGFV